MSYDNKNIKKKQKPKKVKKVKQEMSITEAVGDTSGYTEQEFTKSRKSVVIYGLIGIALLIVFVILFLSTPKKVTFAFQDLQTKSVRYTLNNDGYLIDGPHNEDIVKNYYQFAGWYLNKECTLPSDGLNLSSTSDSLLEYCFGRFKNATVYAKWEAIEYNIDYDVAGNITNLSLAKVNELKKVNKSLNPTTYTVKHELSSYEKNQYIEYIRTTDIDKYVNSNRAYQNILEALELYNNNSKLDYLTLNPISLSDIKMSGYEFSHWINKETGEEITQINKIDPCNLTIQAVWIKTK